MQERYDISWKAYRWFYDNVHSRYYNLLMSWCFLPFGGEPRARSQLIEEIGFAPGEKILDLCCGTGLDLSAGQIRVAR